MVAPAGTRTEGLDARLDRVCAASLRAFSAVVGVILLLSLLFRFTPGHTAAGWWATSLSLIVGVLLILSSGSCSSCWPLSDSVGCRRTGTAPWWHS